MIKSDSPVNHSVPSPGGKTPLYQTGVEMKARFTNFGGWEMPLQYTSIIEEHQAVRNGAGMFDISHMGKFNLQGKNLMAQLEKLVPSDLRRLQPGQSQYTVLLNPQGGIIDDIIIYRQSGKNTDNEKVVIIVNASTTDKDRNWLSQNLDLNQIQFEDLSRDKILIALQGPKATAILQSFVADDLTPIKAFGHLETEILGGGAFLARTGYTGEDGFEIMVDSQTGLEFWQRLHGAGVTPCGLGCRDTLRLEAAMSLYGQDIDDNTTPLEAGLAWLVHLDRKGDFIGRDILERQKIQGVERKLVGLQTQGRNIPRHGYSLLSSGKIIGQVTSGTLSPTLNYPIALAYVTAELANIKQQIEVDIRGKTYPAQVVKRPFYKSQNRVHK
ncbi:glycine cleavage system protein T [Cylindrospermopsis raciborskii S07]|uniref:glycine cleavage system aminomethyltransferase GcvT n=1 Tax=Cylindrospermopsis raciborskii TaxID=77022 RepID=UPI000C9E53DB|nr:glycine cleavage system aminomethyltransferase GcvT [Cylindrospermopsis raciborskii]PNK01546.1 glycine cleavage system protein T [Cylindrospermopsis raciborskii S10]PNK09208.1 glycine cleavage system protein T [Cylindrospermopsis raciborskii S07]PNK09560.1 glycine cleavage system protein T [Cylindrospermopsis raciborskii S14]PNK17103.1 glycine cleavage system protein T [Cylindrospermopsis raciborskii S06]PNK19641.1 glycine cleavage system protein T [Cylindrospermopsis raciborskii S05]